MKRITGFLAMAAVALTLGAAVAEDKVPDATL